LGSIIRSISVSPDGNLYALSLADNSIKFIDAVSSDVTVEIRGLALAHSLPGERENGGVGTKGEKFIRDPRNPAAVICRGVPGRLQIYHPLTVSGEAASDNRAAGFGSGRHVAEISVSMRSQLSRTERVKRKQRVLIAPDRVDAWDIDASGSWLATLESSTLEISPCRAKLKLWHRSVSDNNFVCVATVRNPHGTNPNKKHFVPQHLLNERTKSLPEFSRNKIISSVGIKFRPDPFVSSSSQHSSSSIPSLVTVASNNLFKFWKGTTSQVNPSVNQNQKNAPVQVNWQCSKAGDFKKRYPAKCLCFSDDGSVLAIAYGQLATLWDANSLSLNHTLSHGPSSEQVKIMEMTSKYLVCSTVTKTIIWDVLTLSRVAVLPVSASCIACPPLQIRSPYLAHFAVMLNVPGIESKPVLVIDCRQPYAPRKVAWAHRVSKQGHLCFLSANASSRTSENVLVYLNDQFEFQRLNRTDEKEPVEVTKTKQGKSSENTPGTYGHFFDENSMEVDDVNSRDSGSKLDLSETLRASDGIGPRDSGIRDLISAPSHLLQDVQSIYDSMMRLLLPKRAKPLQTDKKDEDSSSSQMEGINSSRKVSLENPGSDEAQAKQWRAMDAATLKAFTSEKEDPFSWKIDFFSQIIKPELVNKQVNKKKREEKKKEKKEKDKKVAPPAVMIEDCKSKIELIKQQKSSPAVTTPNTRKRRKRPSSSRSTGSNKKKNKQKT